MADTITIPKTMRCDLSVKDIAEVFCQMDDDAQAQFFVEAAKIMSAWPGVIARSMQAQYIGAHLRDCECSTYEARDLIESIHYAKPPGTPAISSNAESS